jgi:mono/diheme cytochrome c family protein
MKRKSILTTAAIALSIIGFAFTTAQQSKPWPVPDKYAKMKNPDKSNAESISAGKSLWNMHCSSCHGKKGLGDGTKAAQLKTQPQDMTLASFQSQSDGSIFYKTSEGRNDMPSFKKKIPDPDDIWSLVNYIRTLKK